MKIHYFQHVPFENLASIEKFFNERECEISVTQFYEGENPPNIEDLDWLIIMGGPMSVHEEAQYPWLKTEKDFVRTAINKGKTVIGICLGAQILADVLGAKVYKNNRKEIGWFDVNKNEAVERTVLKGVFPKKIFCLPLAW